MKDKITIKEELSLREYKTPSKLMASLNHLITSIIGKKYHCEYHVIDDINDEKGPAFIIFNHLSRFDHIFINQIVHPRRYNFLAAHNEFYRGAQYTLFKLDKVIPKMNFNLDFTALKAIKKVIKENGTVCFAPEGMTPMDGLNHPVVPGTGRFLKYFNIPVYQIELRGQFLIASKCCLDERLGGKCSATIRKLYDKETLSKMTGDEIDNDLNNRMRHDEYAWQKEHHYKYNLKGESCKNLEDLLFMCPKCGSKFNMKTDKDKIYCTNCENIALLDNYYDLKPIAASVIPSTISEWSNLERMQIIKDIRDNNDYSFKIKVKLGKLPLYKPTKGGKTSILCGEGEMEFNHNGVYFKGTKDDNEFNFFKDYKELYTILTPLDFKYFSFYVDKDFYDFYPESDFGKVGYLQFLVEEMHRLHVNTLKNFTWNEYMYKEI